MTEENSKLFEAHIILNWKTKEIRVMKKKPKGNSPFEIPIKMHIKVKIPEFKEIVARGEIEIPQYKVEEMVIENLFPPKEEK